MNWKTVFALVTTVVMCSSTPALAVPDAGSTDPDSQTEQTPEQNVQYTAEEQQYVEWAQGIWDSLSPRTGEISLDEAGVTLNVPDDFYFLNAQDAAVVLEDVWGNPHDPYVLGMLFPAGVTPFDMDGWAVEIQYEEDGNVSDDDAATIDYDELLHVMQEDTRAANEERVKNGYEPIELVGWAARPFYDTEEKKLHWAQELKFGDMEENTLNYNVRVLGRKGVLVLNFIADMAQKTQIEQSLDSVLAMAEFNPGARYADFNPDIDKAAAYGIGTLIAGKAASKVGLLAAVLLFLKKFGVYIALAFTAVFGKLLGRKKKQGGENAE